MATVGKMIYHDNPRKLAMMVGDKGFNTISITKDNLLQDYRIFIKRAESDDKGINNGNSLLFTLLQAQLIDQKMFANLFNRSNPELIAKSIRQFHREKAQAENMTLKAETEADAQLRVKESEQEGQMLQSQAEQEQKMLAMNDIQHNQKLDEIALKEGAKTERELLKNNVIQ